MDVITKESNFVWVVLSLSKRTLLLTTTSYFVRNYCNDNFVVVEAYLLLRNAKLYLAC